MNEDLRVRRVAEIITDYWPHRMSQAAAKDIVKHLDAAARTPREVISAAVLREQAAQDEKWGEQNHPDGTSTDRKVYADRARAMTDKAAREKFISWLHILDEEVQEAFAETNEAALYEELKQVAAVAQQWMAAIQRRKALRDEAQV